MDKVEFSTRLLNFAADVIKLTNRLNSSYTAHHLTKQVIRSATSMGANYEEACNAESRNDFVHKLQIVLKESQETLFWLRLIEKSELLPILTDEDHRIFLEAAEIN